MLDEQALTSAILLQTSRYAEQGHDLYDIGNGLCIDFAEDVLETCVGPDWVHRESQENWRSLFSNELYKPLPGHDTTEDAVQWDWDMLQSHWNISPSKEEQTLLDKIVLLNPGHCWITLNGKHFDCEHPEGVSSFFDLNFFKRWISFVGQR